MKGHIIFCITLCLSGLAGALVAHFFGEEALLFVFPLAALIGFTGFWFDEHYNKEDK